MPYMNQIHHLAIIALEKLSFDVKFQNSGPSPLGYKLAKLGCEKTLDLMCAMWFSTI